MERKNWFAAGLSILTVIFLVFAASLLLIKVLWVWTIPDLFPGAVEQGLIAPQITWLTAFKLSVFIAVIAGLTGSKHRDRGVH